MNNTSQLESEPTPSSPARAFNFEALTQNQVRLLGWAITAAATSLAGADKNQPARRRDAEAVEGLEEQFVGELAIYFARDPDRRLPLFVRMAASRSGREASLAIYASRNLLASHPDTVLATLVGLRGRDHQESDDDGDPAEAAAEELATLEESLTPDQLAWIAEQSE